MEPLWIVKHGVRWSLSKEFHIYNPWFHTFWEWHVQCKPLQSCRHSVAQLDGHSSSLGRIFLRTPRRALKPATWVLKFNLITSRTLELLMNELPKDVDWMRVGQVRNQLSRIILSLHGGDSPIARLDVCHPGSQFNSFCSARVLAQKLAPNDVLNNTQVSTSFNSQKTFYWPRHININKQVVPSWV